MTRMRTILVAASLAAVATLAGTGAAGAQAPPPAPAVPTIVPNVLTVGLNLPTQGFQVGAVQRGQVVYARGLEVDLARTLARRVGLRGVRFVQQPTFAGIVAPGTKRWDIAFAQVTATAGRRRAVKLTVPYLDSDQGVLLRRGLPDPAPTTLAQLAGLRLCVERSTTAAALVPRRIAPATPATAYRDETLMMQALQTGACDAVVRDAAILAVQSAATPERYGPLVGTIPTSEHYAAVLPRTSTILPPVNRALNGMRRDGTLTALTTRWLSANPAALPTLK